MIANGRDEEALRVLAKYHGEGSVDHPMVVLELAEMRGQISTTASDKTWWDYRDLYSTKGARARLLACWDWGIFDGAVIPGSGS